MISEVKVLVTDGWFLFVCSSTSQDEDSGQQSEDGDESSCLNVEMLSTGIPEEKALSDSEIKVLLFYWLFVLLFYEYSGIALVAWPRTQASSHKDGCIWKCIMYVT